MTVTAIPTPTPLQGAQYWKDLRNCAEVLDTMMSTRVKIQNMIYQAEHLIVGSAEGKEQKRNLENVQDPRRYVMLESVEGSSGWTSPEKVAEESLISLFAESDFRDFAERPGLGDKIVARILGHLGDPLVATPSIAMNNPKHDPNKPAGEKNRVTILVEGVPYYRTVSQLWQYCGHGAPGRRTRGMSQKDAMSLGNPMLKKLVWNAAHCCMMHNRMDVVTGETPLYRKVYDERKAETAGKLHTKDCAQCKSKGKIGLPWTDGHRHSDALRITGKQILLDLWLEARKLHGFED